MNMLPTREEILLQVTELENKVKELRADQAALKEEGAALREKVKGFPVEAEGIKGVRFHVTWETAQRTYDFYSRLYGTDQSLERLKERGGFGLTEMLGLLRGDNPHRLSAEGKPPHLIMAEDNEQKDREVGASPFYRGLALGC